MLAIKKKRENVLLEIRITNPNRLITGHLNINSLRNKLEMLEKIIKSKIGIFLISETKLDSSFPVRQGLSLRVREDTPSKILNKYTSEEAIENVFVEMNFKSRKLLLPCSCNSRTNSI